MELLAGFMYPKLFGGGVDARMLAKLSQSGDASAMVVLEESARRTGQLCATLADIFSPQKILLGSLARYLGKWWIDVVRRRFTAEVLSANGGSTHIEPAALGERLQDLSAIAPAVFSQTT